MSVKLAILTPLKDRSCNVTAAVRFTNKIKSDFKWCLFYVGKQGEFLLSKAHETEASNGRKVKFHGWVTVSQKKYFSPRKDFSSLKLKALSEWGKHHITTPFHTWESKRLEIKRGGGPFRNVGIQFWLHLDQDGNTTTLHPAAFAPFPAPGCYGIRISKQSLGSLFLCNTAAATHSRVRDVQRGASLHRVAKVMPPGRMMISWQEKPPA